MRKLGLLVFSVFLVSCGGNETPLHESKKAGIHVKENVKTEVDWYEGFDSLDSWNVLEEGGYKVHGRQQFYTPRNVRLSRGNLEIKTKPESLNGYNYTSGAVTTRGKKTFLYGKLEIEAKFPFGQGLMPAIWLLPDSGDALPEIDIAELLGQHPTQLFNVVHWDDEEKRRSYEETTLPDLSKGFHTYGIDWNEDRIIFTFDGDVTHISNYSPDVPMYLLINTSVGGVWAGDPVLDEERVFKIRRVLYSRD